MKKETPRSIAESSSEATTQVPVTIKLSDVATTYIEALQRLFDYSAMTLGATRLINEQDYDEFSRGMGVMPANKSRLGYDDAKEETERWLLKHVLAEALGVSILAMADCRTICALADWKSRGEDQAELQKILGDQRREFDQMNLTDKIAHLKKTFNVSTAFEEHLNGFSLLRQTLVARGGTVSKDDLNGAESLNLKFKMVQLLTAPSRDNSPSSVQVTTQVGDAEKSIAVGSKVKLNKNEHVGIIITLAFFISALMQSVQEFGRTKGMR